MFGMNDGVSSGKALDSWAKSVDAHYSSPMVNALFKGAWSASVALQVLSGADVLIEWSTSLLPRELYYSRVPFVFWCYGQAEATDTVFNVAPKTSPVALQKS